MILIPSENPDTEGMRLLELRRAARLRRAGRSLSSRSAATAARGRRGAGTRSTGCDSPPAGWGNTPHPEADVLDRRHPPGIRSAAARPADDGRAVLRAASTWRETNWRPVRRAVEAGDLDAAKAAFLDHMRSRRRAPVVVRLARAAEPARSRSTAAATDGTTSSPHQRRLDRLEGDHAAAERRGARPASRSAGTTSTRLAFSSTYGDRTPSPETVLVFDAVELVGDEAVVAGRLRRRPTISGGGAILQPTTELVKQGRAGRHVVAVALAARASAERHPARLAERSTPCGSGSTRPRPPAT